MDLIFSRHGDFKPMREVAELTLNYPMVNHYQ
uniref:Uncharacterized protein n=1 Tax=Siphoviridae sp. ctyvQ1 TaxID=2826525 RepID=A0A8S5QZ75_9CAUD|nr:MAG TPA: hypothetical protein [Siphoviridae sp. ctyvQ1]